MKVENMPVNEGAQLGRKVIVSSLYPLGGNYGGLMQAYALQRVIREMGFDVATINSSRKLENVRFIARNVRYFLEKVRKRDKHVAPLTPKQTHDIQEFPRKFLAENINVVDLFGISRRQRKKVLSETKAIIVGSDQVWRGGYANVPDQLLQYATDYPLIKASYAASFGADKPVRFSPRLMRKSRKLAQRFSAISVRENSGIQICHEIWGRDALQHIDPTLLLDRADYQQLIDNKLKSDIRQDGYLFAYILDSNHRTEILVTDVAKQLHLNISNFFMDRPLKKMKFKRIPDRYRMKSVEEWLLNFSQADFVVTDSFHGTVFSIIFNKPFIAVGNRARGLSRFESLLCLLGLESRLVDLDSPPKSLDLSIPDWRGVEKVLTEERARSREYLRKVLGVNSKQFENI